MSPGWMSFLPWEGNVAEIHSTDYFNGPDFFYAISINKPVLLTQIAVGWDDNAFSFMRMWCLPIKMIVCELSRTDRYKDFFDFVPVTTSMPHSFAIGYVSNIFTTGVRDTRPSTSVCESEFFVAIS